VELYLAAGQYEEAEALGDEALRSRLADGHHLVATRLRTWLGALSRLPVNNGVPPFPSPFSSPCPNGRNSRSFSEALTGRHECLSESPATRRWCRRWLRGGGLRGRCGVRTPR
jgi:hypothetical protein